MLYLARHGHREDYVGNSWSKDWGASALRPHDPGLSGLGHEQARAMARDLSERAIAHIFVSPYLRALETANATSEATGVPIKLEDDLGEWLNPDWFGESPVVLSRTEIEARFPHIDSSYRSKSLRTFPEFDLKAEVWPILGDLLQRIFSQHEGDLLIVAHGGIVRGIARKLIGPDVRLHTPMGSCLRLAEDGHGAFRLVSVEQY